MNVADAASYSSVLLLNLSDNLLEQSRNNTVIVQQEEMDRVGFEPTHDLSQLSGPAYLKRIDGKLTVRIPSCSPFSLRIVDSPYHQ
jgi:hypothetical protein